LRGTLRIARLKFIQAFLQSPRIQLADSKRSVAALRASLPAHQPVAALARRIGKRCIHNLDELLIGLGQGIAHLQSIPHKK